MKRSLILLALALFIGAAIVAHRHEAATVTFTKDVAPIIFTKCANCHRPGEVAPMPFTSYAEVRPWSKAIREAIVEGTMPPWYADPHTSTVKFGNDRRLSEAELKTITAWVDAGAPKGNDKDLPKLPTYTPGWTFGEPDLIVEMPLDYEVPAEGELPMQNFYVKVPFSEERWIEKVELRPGNPAVVHHSIANVVALPAGTKIVNGRAVRGDVAESGQLARETGGLSEGVTREVAQTQDSFTRSGAFKLVGQAPGKGFERHPAGTAKRIPPGMYFQFNMHYQPSGRPEKDRSRLGLWFAKVAVRAGIITVQSSHGARISSAPSVAIKSPLANTSKPTSGRTWANSVVLMTWVCRSSRRLGDDLGADSLIGSIKPKWARKSSVTAVARSLLARLKCCPHSTTMAAPLALPVSLAMPC